jgi:hypothetical protein
MKGFFMKKWSDYLTSPKVISEELGISKRTVDYWISLNKVPEWHFKRLSKVLEVSLGHKLTTIQMRELNECKHT